MKLRIQMRRVGRREGIDSLSGVSLTWVLSLPRLFFPVALNVESRSAGQASGGACFTAPEGGWRNNGMHPSTL